MKVCYLLILVLFCSKPTIDEPTNDTVNTYGACSEERLTFYFTGSDCSVISSYTDYGIKCYEDSTQDYCVSVTPDCEPNGANSKQQFNIKKYYEGKTCPESGFPLNCGYYYATSCI